MEQRGNTPQVCADIADLLAILAKPGPFLTVYLATPGDLENASQHNIGDWQGIRERLVNEGAAETALAAIDAAIPTAHEQGAAMFAVASVDGMEHISHWPTPPVRVRARWSALP